MDDHTPEEIEAHVQQYASEYTINGIPYRVYKDVSDIGKGHGMVELTIIPIDTVSTFTGDDFEISISAKKI